MATISEAAATLSERIRGEGGGLQPEFAGMGEPETAQPEPEEQAEAVEATADDVSEDEQGESSAESEERFQLPETLNELAEMLGVEPADVYGLQFNVDTGDGSERFTLSELKDRATGPIRDEAERARWQDQRRAAEAEVEAQRADLAAKHQQAEALAHAVLQGLTTEEQQLGQRYQALLADVSMQQTNPQAYQVELMRLQARLQDVQQRRAGLTAQAEHLRTSAIEDQNRRLEEQRTKGAAELRRMVPGWDDDAKYEEDAEALSSYLGQSRFNVTEDELRLMTDPRVYYWAEMARRYEALQASAGERPKPIVSPKLRPGAPAVKLPQGRRAELEATERLKASGSISDAQAVLAQRLRRGA